MARGKVVYLKETEAQELMNMIEVTRTNELETINDKLVAQEQGYPEPLSWKSIEECKAEVDLLNNLEKKICKAMNWVYDEWADSDEEI